MSREFFIGYRARQPRATARYVAAVSFILILVAVGAGILLSASQNQPAEASFEFGVLRDYSGILRMDPYPRLDLNDGSTALLVAPFKHGADTLVAEHVGARVTVRGSLIQRGPLRMVEIVPGSMAGAAPGAAERSAAEPPAAPGATEQSPADAPPRAKAGAPATATAPADPATPITVRGEILDGKCWLGVMKPGRGTVHRACARLCLRGGIPALIDFVDERGLRHTALFTTGENVPVPDGVLSAIARPIEVTGTYEPDAAGGIGVFTAMKRTIRVL